MAPAEYSLMLDHYESADGPRVMILARDSDAVRQLSCIFSELAEGTVTEVNLDALPFVGISSDVCIKCLRVSKDPHGIFRLENKGGHSFVWRHSPESWDYFVALLQGLTDSPEPGHHYLSEYPGEDVIVVVSKQEYSIDA